ncbi:MAG: zinc finger domain-containing protein [Chloroflexota bacterium]
MEDILIGYKEGKPCPECGTLIEKIKTGSTSSFICSRCQPPG